MGLISILLEVNRRRARDWGGGRKGRGESPGERERSMEGGWVRSEAEDEEEEVKVKLEEEEEEEEK